jgi:hypothetical protein
MKYSQYKEEKQALGKVNGIFSFLAYILTFKTKEVLSIITLFLLTWIATMILNPEVALSIRKYLIGLTK